MINDATACRVQIGLDTAIALRRDPIKLVGGEAFGFGKVALLVGTLLIVMLIQAFEWAAIDEKRLEFWLRRGDSRERIDPKVQCRK